MPQTGMAARAVVEDDDDDEEIEIELDDDLLENGTDSTRFEIGVGNQIHALPLTLPPRPPNLKTNYSMVSLLRLIPAPFRTVHLWPVFVPRH